MKTLTKLGSPTKFSDARTQADGIKVKVKLVHDVSLNSFNKMEIRLRTRGVDTLLQLLSSIVSILTTV